jgi:hypothetical protein
MPFATEVVFFIIRSKIRYAYYGLSLIIHNYRDASCRDAGTTSPPAPLHKRGEKRHSWEAWNLISHLI